MKRDGAFDEKKTGVVNSEIVPTDNVSVASSIAITKEHNNHYTKLVSLTLTGPELCKVHDDESFDEDDARFYLDFYDIGEESTAKVTE